MSFDFPFTIHSHNFVSLVNTGISKIVWDLFINYKKTILKTSLFIFSLQSINTGTDILS